VTCGLATTRLLTHPGTVVLIPYMRIDLCRAHRQIPSSPARGTRDTRSHRQSPRVKDATRIPLSETEHECARWGFKYFIEAGAPDVPQPNIYGAGALSKTLNMAAYASMHGLMAIPHGHSTPAGLLLLSRPVPCPADGHHLKHFNLHRAMRKVLPLWIDNLPIRRNGGSEPGGHLLRGPNRRIGVIRIERVVGVRGKMPELAGPVGGMLQVRREDGRPVRGAPRGPVDQVGMPLAAARRPPPGFRGCAAAPFPSTYGRRASRA